MKKILIILISIIFLIGCNNKKNEEIKIGVILPLTGNAASQGNDILKGMKMAYFDFMSKIDTNTFKIKMIIEDNSSTTKSSVSALEKIIQVSHPKIIIGPVTTTDMLSMIPIAERNKTILFSPSASSPKLSNSGKYIFRMGPLAPDQAKVLAKYAFETLQIKKVGILFMNDDSGNSHKNAFENSFKTIGGQIIKIESFNRKDIDFKNQLISLKGSNVDAIYIAGTPKTTGLILKQAKELNINVKFISSTGAEGSDCIKIAQNAAEGLIYTSIYMDSTFVAKYIKKYNEYPTIGIALGYDAMAITLKLLKENSNDLESLRMALSHLKFNGVSGNTEMLPTGDARKDISLKLIKNNEFIFLKN
jgi:branched-chain amino acid transport system substrate-binding protein